MQRISINAKFVYSNPGKTLQDLHENSLFMNKPEQKPITKY